MPVKSRGIAYRDAAARANEFWLRMAWGEYCWTWDNPLASARGYGHFKIAGKHEKVHRVAWVLSRREDLAPGEQVCHECDNPACIRPNHLFKCDHNMNMADKARKGRGAGRKGSDHPMAILNEQAVEQIRHLYAAGHLSFTEVGEMFGVSRDTIYQIATGKIWKHVGGPITHRGKGKRPNKG